MTNKSHQVSEERMREVFEVLMAKGLVKKHLCPECDGGWHFTPAGKRLSEIDLAKIGLHRIHADETEGVAMELAMEQAEYESFVIPKRLAASSVEN